MLRYLCWRRYYGRGGYFWAQYFLGMLQQVPMRFFFSGDMRIFLKKVDFVGRYSIHTRSQSEHRPCLLLFDTVWHRTRVVRPVRCTRWVASRAPRNKSPDTPLLPIFETHTGERILKQKKAPTLKNIYMSFFVISARNLTGHRFVFRSDTGKEFTSFSLFCRAPLR